jgi:hypothetical protein
VVFWVWAIEVQGDTRTKDAPIDRAAIETGTPWGARHSALPDFVSVYIWLNFFLTVSKHFRRSPAS